MLAAAFYNEIDPFAAAWLRELIKAGHIAPGVVDERSIEDIKPRDLDGFSQCHFFAGIGVWSLALRRAGWPDDRPVWTGSCPCQPFSAAGQGAGFDDQRHLWPHFHWLIQECKPASVIGEQVASKDADPWLDLVSADLEALGFAFGAVAFPSAGVGAPHIRDRTYWVAHSDSFSGRQGREINRGRDQGGDAQSRAGSGSGGLPVVVANPHQHGQAALPEPGLQHAQHHVEPCGTAGGLGHAGDEGLAQRLGLSGVPGRPRRTSQGQAVERAGFHLAARPGPTNGFWRDVDWLLCRDGKWRPVEPGTFPLAHGAAARVGRLRGYGNAINAYQAQIFIEAAMRPTTSVATQAKEQ